jgi:hypothetical protein
MGLLVVAQQSWNKFRRNASHVQIVCQNALNGPVKQSYYLKTLWIFRLRSARIASRTFAIFSGVVLIDGRPELSSSLTDVRPSLKSLYHNKVSLWLVALSPKGFSSILWVSAAVVFKTETKFDADSSLSHISYKKSPIH